MILLQSVLATSATSSVPSVSAEEVGPDPATVGPGLILLVIFLVLVAGTVLLWRSMRKQIGRIDFDEDQVQERPGSDPAHQD